MRCQLMALCGGDQPIETWTDIEGQPLETRLGDIAVAIVVHGERVCRSSAQHHREWVIKRKAEIVAEERRKEAERRRLERERLERLEKAGVGRLLAQAKALREAEEIRAYVSAVQSAKPRSTIPQCNGISGVGGLGTKPGRSNRPCPVWQLQNGSGRRLRHANRGLYWEAPADWCGDFVRLGDRRK